jgi:hypothetical protein
MPTVDPASKNTITGVVHVRDAASAKPVANFASATQVTSVQLIGDPSGVGLAINGTAYAFTPNMAVSLKKALDRAVTGLVM